MNSSLNSLVTVNNGKTSFNISVPREGTHPSIQNKSSVIYFHLVKNIDTFYAEGDDICHFSHDNFLINKTYNIFG